MSTSLNFNKVTANYKSKADKIYRRIVICAGTGCIASGAMRIYEKLADEIKAQGANVLLDLDVHDCSSTEKNIHLSKSGCQGFCQMGPLVTIYPEEILYVHVKENDAKDIISALKEETVVDRLLYVDPVTQKICHDKNEINFYKRQHRTILKECGHIDPESLSEYISYGGYSAAYKAYTNMSAEDVSNEVKKSGLRGRGGGGFPTGMKWEFAQKEVSEKKYVICNGDEGDPGAFMDRSVMEGNPHSVIEGMLIAAKAIGADEGYIYVRLEYPLAIKRLERAIEDAEKAGILGKNIFGTNNNFKLHILEGAGAFVCGEETALMTSIEGKRGMPMPKPPFPAQKGLFGKPTVINNVETFASVPRIIRDGWKEYRKVGTENSPGTKTFALTGHVANTGLIEVPFGVTLREIVYNIGGGVTDSSGKITGEPFKAVQIGGPSGGCLTEAELDLPLDFDSLASVDAMVGSGGLVVMNKDTCMVSMAYYFMLFTQNESCGKCVPCREGTKQMLSMLDDIMKGEADEKTVDILIQLANAVKKGSLCGLGKTAPNPVISILSKFKEECEAHVTQKRCPSKQCKALLTPEIDPEKCIGCTACVRKCPVDAITGERKKPHVIDENICIKCGACATVCKFNAINGVA